MIVSYLQLEVFTLVLARILGIFITAPFFSARTTPSLAKVSFAVWLSAVLWFVIPLQIEKLPTDMASFFSALIFEVTIGFLIGFITNIIFIAVQAAGELIDLQMGLSVAQSFDPIFGATISVIGRFVFTMALTIFVVTDGHHLLLSLLHQSFKLLPPGSLIDISKPMFVQQIINLGTILWSISIQFAGPIILIIFLSDFAFGIVSRVAPQVNVFMLGFQVKPALGLIAILFTLPLISKHIGGLLGTMAEEVLKMLAVLK